MVLYLLAGWQGCVQLGSAISAIGSVIMERIRWGNGLIDLIVGIDADRPVTIDSLDVAGHERTTPARQPLVELLVLGQGRMLTNTRFTSTAVGDRLRYLGHRTETATSPRP